MFTLTHSAPVNPPGGDQPPLTRDQLWRALLLKAENAVLFVPGMTYCQVLERGDNELYREIVYRGARRKQRVTFRPGEWVQFEHLSGPATGLVQNVIEQDADGGLRLRFTFQMEVQGLTAGSAEEQAYAEQVRADYEQAVQATIDSARRLLASGQLASAAAS